MPSLRMEVYKVARCSGLLESVYPQPLCPPPGYLRIDGFPVVGVLGLGHLDLKWQFWPNPSSFSDFIRLSAPIFKAAL